MERETEEEADERREAAIASSASLQPNFKPKSGLTESQLSKFQDDSLQAINVQLDGKNYSYWSYVMKIFLRGKSMWGYVTGTKVKPTKPDSDGADPLETWEADNSKIITWINNSVSQSIGAQLAKYETAKEVWDHLTRLYTQSNFAKQYQLEADIRALKQKDMSIQEFYFAMSDLWDQLSLTESADLRAFSPYVTRREEQRLVQFLMALRSDFEGLRGSILHRSPLPSLDSVVNELLAEEIRLQTHVSKGIVSTSTASIFDAPQKPINNNPNQVNLRIPSDECAFCHQKNHWKTQCPLLLNKGKQQQPRSQQQQPRFQQQRATRPPQQPPAPSPSHWSPRPSPPSNAVAAPSLDPYLFEQFQKFIGSQPHAMSASSNIGLSHSNSSGPAISEADWDRP